MNPGMLFDEVLESHEFWPSDSFRGRFPVRFGHACTRIPVMSDNATLLDIVEVATGRRKICNSLAQGAALD